jgi:hypothetical protein
VHHPQRVCEGGKHLGPFVHQRLHFYHECTDFGEITILLRYSKSALMAGIANSLACGCRRLPTEDPRFKDLPKQAGWLDQANSTRHRLNSPTLPECAKPDIF